MLAETARERTYTFAQTLYVCPKCRAIEFTDHRLDGKQDCCECGEALNSYPVKNLDELGDALTEELGTIAPLTDLIHPHVIYMGVPREEDGVEVADSATISNVPELTRRRMADLQTLLPGYAYSRMAAFRLTEIPCEEKL